MEQCGTCRFWVRSSDDATALAGGGYCRRFPPTFQERGALNDGWPNTHQQSWCGEYRAGKNQMTQ